jgi:NADH-quinone oxidoreductase subunit F
MAASKEIQIKIGLASCGIASGGAPLWDVFNSLAGTREDVEIKKVGCLGYCFAEPMVEVICKGVSTIYGYVNEEVANKIVSQHINGGRIVEENILLADGMETENTIRAQKQMRVVLRNCGVIHHEKIDEYLEKDG